MEYLARVVVGLVSLFKELIGIWMNGQGGITANVTGAAHANIGDSLSYIFANGVNFIAQLAAQILHQMGNTTS